jgi:Glycosyltransferases, probably involved in cell wall biogenesis
MALSQVVKHVFRMELKDIVGQFAGRTLPVKGFSRKRSLLRRSRRHKARRAPTISVIIPAHNEERYLRKTLLALRRQSFRKFEVIVVANGCTDRTEDVARELCDRLVVLSQKCLGVARNLGARMAKGDILVFLDADTLLDRHALRTISERFTRRHAAGTVIGKPDSSRFAYRVIYGVKNLIHRTSLHHGSSGVILCWREHFMKLGGFKENLEVRENSELMKRLERFGRYTCIRKATAVTSMRRYDQRGVGRMCWMWTRLWFESFFRDLGDRKYETIR